MCNEFSETELLETGDVKYHLGTRGEVTVTCELIYPNSKVSDLMFFLLCARRSRSETVSVGV